MVKFLSCADCGKIFRGERRRPCSDHVLALLRRKYPESNASALDFVHDSCLAPLRRQFDTLGQGEQQVCPFYIRVQMAKLTSSSGYLTFPLWALLLLVFYLSSIVQAPCTRKRPRGTVLTLEETRKSWDEVDRRIQEKRRRVVLDVCEQIKIPPSAVADPSPSLGPEETYVELPRPCQRKRARSLGARIASERGRCGYARCIYSLTLCGVRQGAPWPRCLRGIRHGELSPRRPPHL